MKKILVVENRKAQLVDAKKFESEATLQTYLEQFPSLLPVWEVDENAAPLLTIGREVAVPSGAVDLLFTDAGGLLTVVETKLARVTQDGERTNNGFSVAHRLKGLVARIHPLPTP